MAARRSEKLGFQVVVAYRRYLGRDIVKGHGRPFSTLLGHSASHSERLFLPLNGRGTGLLANVIGPDGPGDVLDLLLAEVCKGSGQLSTDLVAHRSRDANPTGLGERFAACGDGHSLLNRDPDLTKPTRPGPTGFAADSPLEGNGFEPFSSAMRLHRRQRGGGVTPSLRENLVGCTAAAHEPDVF
jgi:hypothetical protein